MPVAKSRTVTRLRSARPALMPKVLFKISLTGANDKINHRRRGVVNAAAFAHVLVVSLQKPFVEIDIGVFGEQQAFFLGGGKKAALAFAEGQILPERG